MDKMERIIIEMFIKFIKNIYLSDEFIVKYNKV